MGFFLPSHWRVDWRGWTGDWHMKHHQKIIGPRTGLIAAAVVSALLTAFVVGCDPGHNVTTHNDTVEEVTVYWGTYRVGLIPASDGDRYRTGPIPSGGERVTTIPTCAKWCSTDGKAKHKYHFEARNREGQTIWTLDVSQLELEAMDWTIRVTKSSSRPP